MQLDATGIRIPAALQANGALSNVELARRAHLSRRPRRGWRA
ncbi:MAG: Lrp/AsnC family transcriptional regulator [Burkholderiaceae bacterium]|nr:Lrp/AsnC family transcriptional regulator [Burkholderiaceae bacterium]